MTDIETRPWEGMSPEDAYRKGYSDGTRLEPVSVCVRCAGRGEAEDGKRRLAVNAAPMLKALINAAVDRSRKRKESL